MNNDEDDSRGYALFRQAIWKFGMAGWIGGLCLGFLISPYSKRWVGPHSNLVTPLGFGILCCMLGSGYGAGNTYHHITYSNFIRKEKKLQLLKEQGKEI